MTTPWFRSVVLALKKNYGNRKLDKTTEEEEEEEDKEETSSSDTNKDNNND